MSATSTRWRPRLIVSSPSVVESRRRGAQPSTCHAWDEFDSAASMFKFVADNVKGAGTKRKQSHRPCATCKYRHKRCSHGAQTKTLSAASQDTSSRPDVAVNDSPATQASVSPNQTNPEEGSDDAHIRFVANLSPESAFILNPRHQGSQSIARVHGVGLWTGQQQEASPKEPAGINDQVAPSQALAGFDGSSLLISALRPALRHECIATIPREYELGLLTELFYAKIDPIFPILRDEPWEKHGVMESTALKQCICLVASLDPAMRPHLRLPHTDVVLSQIDFRARIAAVVKQSLDLGFITDKVVLTQVCSLMSMYVEENQGFGQLSTYYCAQAVLHEQTLGFHVGWPDGFAGGERSRRILWCVWVLDRLNAAINGRPTLIHRRDMDRKVLNSIDNQPAPFKLLIRIAEFLDHTVSLYRPHVIAQGQTENPEHTFEDFVEAAGAQNLSNGLLASLELFYLSVVILRGRSAGQRPSLELQWFSASRIVAVASGEFKSSLVSWPVLPYAVTVAASVAYRSLRTSPMSYNRRRAYTLFQDSCEVLEDLSKAFLSARAIARLAMDTMQEVERVATERRDSLRPPDVMASEAQEGQSAENDAQQLMGDTRLQHPLNQVYPMTGDYLGSNLFNGFDGEGGIFGSFDPSFDLTRTDAIFSANLDLNVPPLWGSSGTGDFG